MNCTDISTLLSTFRRSNVFLARHGDTCATNDTFLMRSYLQHLDIDGATICARHGSAPVLTIYFNAVISTSSGRHGAAFLAKSRRRKGTKKNVFYGCFEQ